MAERRRTVDDEDQAAETQQDEAALPKEETQGPAIKMDARGQATPVEKPDPDEDRVAMFFPKVVNLQHKGIMYKFEAGVQMVRKHLVDPELHWYLKAHGVKKAATR